MKVLSLYLQFMRTLCIKVPVLFEQLFLQDQHYFNLRECEELQASFLLEYRSSPLLEMVAEEAQ